MRLALAEVLLRDFAPRLVILDEFQKFRDLLPRKRAVADEKPCANVFPDLAGLLLRCERPTLLLSATPYRSLDYGEPVEKGGLLSHLGDLEDTLSFLFDDRAEAEQTISMLEKHGKDLMALPEGERAFLAHKQIVSNR
jgi:hypothetical protein